MEGVNPRNRDSTRFATQKKESAWSMQRIRVDTPDSVVEGLANHALLYPTSNDTRHSSTMTRNPTRWLSDLVPSRSILVPSLTVRLKSESDLDLFLGIQHSTRSSSAAAAYSSLSEPQKKTTSDSYSKKHPERPAHPPDPIDPYHPLAPSAPTNSNSTLVPASVLDLLLVPRRTRSSSRRTRSGIDHQTHPLIESANGTLVAVVGRNTEDSDTEERKVQPRYRSHRSDSTTRSKRSDLGNP